MGGLIIFCFVLGVKKFLFFLGVKTKIGANMEQSRFFLLDWEVMGNLDICNLVFQMRVLGRLESAFGARKNKS